MCAEPFEGAQVRAFGKQPDVDLTQYGWKTVRIVDFLRAAGPDDAQPVIRSFVMTGGARRRCGNGCLEETRVCTERFDFALRQFGQNLAGIGIDREDRFGAGLQGAQPQTSLGVLVQSQDGERIAMFGAAERQCFGLVQHARPPVSRFQAGFNNDAIFQVSVAYSRIVRSEENAPMPATLRIALRCHSSGDR